MTATDRLYQGPTVLSMDVINVIRRINLLSFNAVRLPFSMSDLINLTNRDFHYTYCQNIAQSDIIQSVTNPNVSVPVGAPCLDPPLSLVPFCFESCAYCHTILYLHRSLHVFRPSAQSSYPLLFSRAEGHKEHVSSY